MSAISSIILLSYYAFEPFEGETLGPWGPCLCPSVSSVNGHSTLHLTTKLNFATVKKSILSYNGALFLLIAMMNFLMSYAYPKVTLTRVLEY